MSNLDTAGIPSLRGASLRPASRRVPPRTERFLQCRQCHREVAPAAASCPGCGCRAPFACAECGRAVGAASLGIPETVKHPYGGFTPAGMPLCHSHRLTRCTRCERLFPQETVLRRLLGHREDTLLRERKTPRLEPVYGYFCRRCNAAPDPEPVVEPALPHRYLWLVGLMIAGGAGVLALLALFA